MKKSLSEITVESQGSVIKFLTKGMIENYSFPYPNEEKLKELSVFFTTILRKTDQNKRAIETLSQTRDRLLPKLLNGSVRVEGFGG